MHQPQEGNNVTTPLILWEGQGGGSLLIFGGTTEGPLILWEGQGGGSLLIFGGTTEGRLAVDVCEQAGKPFYYSTKGDLQKVDLHNGVHITGAMTVDDIVSFCKEHNIGCIVDAAHPFAENLHKTIDEARKVLSINVIRLQRVFPEHIKGVEYCSDKYDKKNAASPPALPRREGAGSQMANYIQNIESS